MSIQPDRAVRIRSIAEELRHLELEDDEIIVLLGLTGLADSKILAGLNGLSTRLDASAAATATALVDLAAQIDSGISEILDAILGPPSPPAVSARLTLVNNQGESEPMPSVINVDTLGEKLVLEFTDRTGEVTPDVPFQVDGVTPAIITYGTSDEAVATIDSSGSITPVGAGTVALSVDIANADGSPVLEADGVTPFNPAPVSVEVDPGAAVGARIAVTDTAGDDPA